MPRLGDEAEQVRSSNTSDRIDSAPARQAPKGGFVRGVARGVAIGAVGGAIGGSAGKRPAIGAAVGGLPGAITRFERSNMQINMGTLEHRPVREEPI
jgi:hypothetical protein